MKIYGVYDPCEGSSFPDAFYLSEEKAIEHLETLFNIYWKLGSFDWTEEEKPDALEYIISEYIREEEVIE